MKTTTAHNTLIANLFRIILSFSVLFFSCNQAMAQATSESAYANMQRAVGGIVQSATASRGYVANDPRTYATLQSMGTAAVSTASGAGTAFLFAGSLPAWGTVLAASVVTAAVAWAVPIVADASIKWLFGSGSITMTMPSTAAAGTYDNAAKTKAGCPMVSNVMNWCAQAGDTGGWLSFPMCSGDYNPTYLACGPNGNYSGSGQTDAALASLGYTPRTATGSLTSSVKTLTEAVSALSAPQKQQKVSYEAMALLINETWKKAASQPSYAGVPYSVSKPITASDVQIWEQANPNAYPTVDSLFSPISSPAVGLAPSTSTGTGTEIAPAVSPTASSATNTGQSNPSLNLGPDPNINAPNLETTPTASQILSPIIGLFPSFKNFTVPAHSGECPKPAFDAFGKHFVMDSHCTMFEQNRSVLTGFMLLAFALIAIFIVLSA